MADQVTDEQRKNGLPFPPLSNILETEVSTTVRVATLVFSPKIAGVYRPVDSASWYGVDL
jgi:malate dehydrogenase (oxaloacetate-decarboxylating)(NADP+)